MAEYDSRTINCGLKYSFWKDYINAVVEMTECKHLSGGVIFKVNAARKSKVDDNTARMQSIKQLGV